MANPAKRRTGGSATTGSGTPGSPSAKPVPPKAKAKVRAAEQAPTRYTPPSATGGRGPSPRWVPITMFGLWIGGVLVIMLNYMGVLPGAADDGNGWYLVAGLVAILGGIMAATQYR